MMEKYSKQSVWVHWLSAVLIIAMIVTGQNMEEAPADAAKVLMLQIHVVTGLAAFALTIYRLFLYSFEKKKNLYPTPLQESKKWKANTQKWTHFALRNLLMGLSITGILALFLTNLFPVFIEGNPDLYTQFQDSGVHTAHAILSKIYILLFLVHLIGIVQHIIFQKQNVFKRII